MKKHELIEILKAGLLGEEDDFEDAWDKYGKYQWELAYKEILALIENQPEITDISTRR